MRRRKGIRPTWATLKSMRAARPYGAPLYVILDNLPAHKNRRILRWAARNKVELCFASTNASWANPIEERFGPLPQFTLANSNYPNHTVRTCQLHGHLRWRNRVPVIRMSWPPSDLNAPASAVRRASARAADHSSPRPGLSGGSPAMARDQRGCNEMPSPGPRRV